MSLTFATLLPALLLLGLGSLLVTNNSAVVAIFKALPRSAPAAYLFFGLGAAWFLYHVWHLSPADFGQFRTPLFFAFATVALLSFFYAPDFLAVRGLAVLTLLGAWPLLMAAYHRYDEPTRLFMVSVVYLFVCLALYLGAAPYRLRDFFDWLFRVPGRARFVGSALAAYGLLLTFVAFTY